MAGWIYGSLGAVAGLDQFGQFSPMMLTTQAFYFGDRVKRQPLVGDRYPAGAVVTVGFPPRRAALFRLSVQLPPGTRFADGPPGTPSADGFFDLGWRDWAQGTLSEIRFDLITDTAINGAQLSCRTESEYGTTFSSVPINAYPQPGPPSGRLAIRLEPHTLPLGPQVANFTVVMEDTGSFLPVAGLVRGWSFLPDKNRSRIPILLSTNGPSRLIFYLGPRIYHTGLPLVYEFPSGRARALLGYEQDIDIDVPFQFNLPFWGRPFGV